MHEAGHITLGVDTTVHLGQRVYAKPSGEDGAPRCSGTSPGAHEVISGVCLITQDGETVEHAGTRVTFRRLDELELERYVASGEWEGRAGGYAIQGLGGRLIERIDGDYLNVVGLPAALLLGLLELRAPQLLGR